ncbi:MAG: M23 family metallopeptidase, partial [Alphaproteobacteria bacterium]
SGGGYYGSPAPYGAAPAPSSSPSGSIQAVPLDPIPVVQTAPLPPPPKVEPKPAPAAVPSPPKTTAVDTLNKPVETKPVATTIAPTTNLHTTPPPSLPAPAPTSAPKTEMVWPVQGPVLSAFGGKGQGLSNDGVNIGAPKGAPIVAAQNGIVVYAGNEMKGFGNLILIRHADGWVTAYAHLDRMLVNKDGVVAQGDMIGTVGKTGNVPSPQLHFETRYEGKPIDPSTVIKAQ